MKIINILLMLLFFTMPGYAWENENFAPEYNQVPHDSFYIENYKVVLSHYEDSTGTEIFLENILSLYKDKHVLITVYGGKSQMYNYCASLPYLHDGCFLQDINKDGFKEVIVEYSLTGASCCEGAGHLFSLRDTAALILEMPPADTRFQIRDYENDSIPEIVTVDGVFQFFFDYNFRAFMEPLFWKWDGTKYKIANKQFAARILNALGPNQMPAMKDLAWVDSVQLSASNIIGVPSYQYFNMVFGYYAAGMPDKADSLFDQYWPDGVNGKDVYYKEIKNRIKNDPYWPQILDSDW
jgi:hypothetical protein